LQPLLVLFNARFTEIVRGVGGSPLSASLPADDLYFIAVAAPDALSPGGNYAITLSSGASAGSSPTVASTPRDVQPGQNTISFGERVRGTISASASAFTFQFSGSAGDNITINMARAGGDLDSYLFLLDSGGVALVEDDNSGGGNGDAAISASLPADGDYLILATRLNQDAGTTSGAFLLSLASDTQPIAVAPPPTSGSGTGALAGLPEINPGDSVTGSISNQVFFNPYVLRATAGEEIVITMEAVEDLDPLVILLADNQEPLAENDDVDDGNQDSRLEFTIPETGSYVIVASRFEQEAGTTTGAYTLTVTRAGEEVSTEEGGTEGSLVQRLNPARISPGGTPAGAFAPLRFANVYAFGVTDAALVDFSVSTDSTIASTIILADERLQPIAVTDGGTLLGVQLPASGNYVFIVAPASGPAQGIEEDYILAFNATGADVILAQEPNDDATDRPPSVSGF
jgi:hypothetical protein